MNMLNPKNNRELSERRRRWKYGRQIARGRLRIEASARIKSCDVMKFHDLAGRHMAIHESWFSIPSRRLLCYGMKANHHEGEVMLSITIASCRRSESKMRLPEGFDKKFQSLYRTIGGSFTLPVTLWPWTSR